MRKSRKLLTARQREDLILALLDDWADTYVGMSHEELVDELCGKLREGIKGFDKMSDRALLNEAVSEFRANGRVLVADLAPAICPAHRVWMSVRAKKQLCAKCGGFGCFACERTGRA